MYSLTPNPLELKFALTLYKIALAIYPLAIKKKSFHDICIRQTTCTSGSTPFIILGTKKWHLYVYL